MKSLFKSAILIFYLLIPLSVAEAASTIEVVSRDFNGNIGDDNSGVFFDTGWEARRSPVLDDGTVVFLSLADLEENEANAAVDVYSYHDGTVQALDIADSGDGDSIFVETDAVGQSLFLIRRSGTLPFSYREYFIENNEKHAFDSDDTAVQGTAMTSDGSLAAIAREDEQGVFQITTRSLPEGGRQSVTGQPGIDGNDDSLQPSLAADGRYIAFATDAWNLIENDTNAARDIYLYDRINETFELISQKNGVQASVDSDSPHISGDASAIGFVTSSDLLTSDDANAKRQVLIFENNSFELASSSPTGAPGNNHSDSPRLSHDGRFIVFTSKAGNLHSLADGSHRQLYVYDRENDTLEILSVSEDGAPADNDCFEPAISPDGRFVTFVSKASNLDAGADGEHYQVYRIDRGENYAGKRPRAEPVYVSGTADSAISIHLSDVGSESDSLSYSIESLPENGDLTTSGGEPVEIGKAYHEESLPWIYTLNNDNQSDFFEYRVADVYLQSLPAAVSIEIIDPDYGLIRRVSVTSQGEESDSDSFPLLRRGLSISRDGRSIVFTSEAQLGEEKNDAATNVYLHDIAEGTTALVSRETPLDKHAHSPALSGDGGYIAYYTIIDSRRNLVLRDLRENELSVIHEYEEEVFPRTAPGISAAGDRLTFTDADKVFLYDKAAEPEKREISLAADGESSADAPCEEAVISAAGNAVAFSSTAGNLVDENTDGTKSIFLHYLKTGETALISTMASGEVLENCSEPAVSANARTVVFIADTGGEDILCLKRMDTGELTELRRGVSTPKISDDGRFVVYRRIDEDQLYRLDTAALEADPVLVGQNQGMQANDITYDGAISASGQFVAFASDADNLVDDDTNHARDVFLNDFSPPANQVPQSISRTYEMKEDNTITEIPLEYEDAEDNDVWFELVEEPEHAENFEILPLRPGKRFPKFNYTPAANYFGNDSVSFRYRDAAGASEVATVTLEIEEVNDIPEWVEVPDDLEIDEGQTLRLDLMHPELPFDEQPYVHDPDIDNPEPYRDVLVFRLSEPEELDWIKIENKHELVLRPDYDIASLDNPEISFDLRLEVTDGRVEEPVPAPETFRVTVNDVPRPPVIESAALEPVEPTSSDILEADVSAYDPDGGEVEIAYRWYEDGVLQNDLTDQNVPAERLDRGEEWRFEAQAEKTTGLTTDWISSETLAILNSPPVAPKVEMRVVEADSGSVDLSEIVYDADDDPLTLSLEDQPAHGIAELSDGLLNYESDWPELAQGEEARDEFFYTVSDGHTIVEGKVVVTVEGINYPPELIIREDLHLESDDPDGQITWEAAGGGMVEVKDIDSSDEELRLYLDPLPGKGVLTTAAGREVVAGEPYLLDDFPLTYTPEPDAAGLDALFVTADDGIDRSNTRAMAIYLAEIAVELSFEQGWNSFSLPLKPEAEGDPEALLVDAGNGEKVYSGRIWRWDTETSRYHPVSRLESATGYFVYCRETLDEPVEVRGTRPQPELALDTGWHFLGPVGYLDALNFQIAGADKHPGHPVWQLKNGRPQAIPSRIHRGKAYWIYLPQPQTIDLRTNDFADP